MKKLEKKYEFILSTGREVYIYGEVIGLQEDKDGRFSITYGYDGHIHSEYFDSEEHLSREEKLEVADYAIAQWNRFKDTLNLS